MTAGPELAGASMKSACSSRDCGQKKYKTRRSLLHGNNTYKPLQSFIRLRIIIYAKSSRNPKKFLSFLHRPVRTLNALSKPANGMLHSRLLLMKKRRPLHGTYHIVFSVEADNVEFCSQSVLTVRRQPLLVHEGKRKNLMVFRTVLL